MTMVSVVIDRLPSRPLDCLTIVLVGQSQKQCLLPVEPYFDGLAAMHVLLKQVLFVINFGSVIYITPIVSYSTLSFYNMIYIPHLLWYNITLLHI